MDLSIHTTFLPHDDREESLAFYRHALGFEVTAAEEKEIAALVTKAVR